MNQATIVVPASGNNEFLNSVYEEFKKDIPKGFTSYRYKGGQLNLPLEPDSPAMYRAIAVLNDKGLAVRLFSRFHYSKKELEAMPFFQLCLPSPLELEGTDASDYGTKYEGRCPVCNFGGTPVRNILVDRKFVKKCQIGWLFPNIIASKAVRELIEENSLTGVSFGERVLDYKGRDIPELYELKVQNVLPPMSKETWLVPQLPKDSPFHLKCGHEIVYLQSDIQYEKEKMDGAADFNLTAEFVNNNRVPELIVSKKTKNLFKEHKIFSFFRPVTLM